MDVAVDRARARWPDADLRAVARTGPVTPAAILCSRWGWRLLGWRADDVVMQWWNDEARGHKAACVAVRLLGTTGRHAVLEDGTWIDFTDDWPFESIHRSLWRLTRGVLIVIAVGAAAALAWPAAAWFRHRERGRLA
jgi:hypothetical protein